MMKDSEVMMYIGSVLIFLVLVAIAIIIVSSLMASKSPCTTQSPTAQDIIVCMKAQPTSTPELTRMTDHNNPGFEEASSILYDRVLSTPKSTWIGTRNSKHFLYLAFLTLITEVERLQVRVDELEALQQKTPPPTEK